MRKDDLKKLHPMRAFGVVSGLAHEIRVNRLEHRLDPAVPFPHKHDFYHFVLVHGGSGWHEIDFQKYPVRPRAFFLMKPAQVHAWSIGKAAKGYVIEFQADGIFPAEEAAILRARLQDLPDSLALNAKAYARVQAVAEKMRDEYEAKRPDFAAANRSLLQLLLVEIARALPTRKEKSVAPESLLAKYGALVEANFRREHRVEFYARALGITAKALTMRLARSAGVSARDLIQDRCLLESKRLLAYSDRSIAEIGYELGFEDPNYFSRFFQKQAGLSPGEFRAKTRSLC